MEAKRNNPSVISFLIIAMAIVASVFYLVTALNTGDAAWFRSNFDETPSQMILHCYGTDVVFEPAEAEYAGINELVNEALSGGKRWDPLTMSVSTYQDYLRHPQMMTLELRYAPPVRLHSAVKFFSRVDTLIIPLDGRHAQYNLVFGRMGDEVNAGSFHIESFDELRSYITAQGLCVKP